MTMEKNTENFNYDSRIIQRHIRAGRIEKSDYEKYLNALPDLKEHSEELGPEIYGERSRLALSEYSSSADHDHDHDEDHN